MSVDQRILQLTQLAAIAVIAVSCYLVLRPFFTAILFALVTCVSTWPLYLRLRRLLKERSSLASLIMVMLLVLLVIGPSALLAALLMDNVTAFINNTKTLLENGPFEPPAWLKQLPLFDARLTEYWSSLASDGNDAVALFSDLLKPARNFLLGAAKAIGQGVLHMVFAAFIGFFLYRDGEILSQVLHNGIAKLAGSLGEEILATIQNTLSGVVQGIFGAALAQAITAALGFFIAGIPGAFLLGTATFFLSMLPIGPPLLWGGASIWLFYQGSYGRAIFMILWGIFAISSIDNVVRPLLISQGSKLSLLLTVLGVFGGIFAFGFIGIFIGPPILAVALTLVRLWTAYPVMGAEKPHRKSR